MARLLLDVCRQPEEVIMFARRSMGFWPLVAGLALAACQPSAPAEVPPTVDCANVTVPTYEELTIWPACTSCHASNLTGAWRRGAPEGVDFDTYQGAVDEAEDAAIEVNIGNMPFTGTITDQQMNDFFAWAMCGTP